MSSDGITVKLVATAPALATLGRYHAQLVELGLAALDGTCSRTASSSPDYRAEEWTQ